jgi:ABC-type nitrate/sulfonate/bicarbonate transport system ATPase subunit
MDGSTIAARGSLDLRGISKGYTVDGKPLEVLSGIGFRVDPGEFVAIVGPSGCGKSTLLRLIIGLDTDYQGDILLDGKRIHGPGAERSIVFQEPRLFPWLTLEENVGLGLDAGNGPRSEQRRSVKDHLDLVRLGGFEKAYPHQLSGGMAQRAAIARALVNRPEILLLDEPLGALDSLNRFYLQEELLRIWRQQQVSAVMVTHDVEEAIYLSNKVVVMEPRPGRVRKIFAIDQPHPRDRSSRDFIALKERIVTELVA